MRILIADDELLERQAMKKFIRENFSEMDVVGEAANGRMAIELAEKMQPNIIFMDIKMPGINGLEAIEQIYASQPSIKFILVSAYNTFEYAKQAMQYGIKDYLLKPGKKEEISHALLRVQKEILHEVTIEEEKQQLLKEKLIRRLIRQHIDHEVIDLQKKLFPTLKEGYFFVLRSEGTYDVQKVRSSLEKQLCQPFILYEVNDVIVVLVLSSEFIRKEEQLTVVRTIQIGLGATIFIGIGRSADSLVNLSLSYREAYTASFQLKKDQKSKYGFFQEDQQYSGHEDLVTQIAQGVEKGNYNETLMVFKENQQILTLDEKENLYIRIQNIFSKRNISIAGSSISSLQTNKDWHAYLNVCCMHMNEYCHSKQSMTKAKDYIEAHYAKGITLEEVAAFVNLSPNYFSNLFKEEFDETFIEFLTKTRMESAKSFIEENSYSLKEISFMVGYKDPNYFSRVFKKYFHSSPRQFQDSFFDK
ncbi:response regulator [Sporosarcina beigongshangi]|uniref:response regulator n=1 Tax=Sporosarcina beigongshangi TaxID=2782538 RepID=UPI0019395A65|nr:response regulator [Sporosarcina beigongshangi]